MPAISQVKAMRKHSILGTGHPRERLMMGTPYDGPGEEPFQAQTESSNVIRGGVLAARYSGQG